MDGNITHGAAACGVIAGSIKEVLPAAEVVRRMVDGYQAVVAGLPSLTLDSD